MKNIIYLVLSSGIPFYRDLEDIIRQTWASDTLAMPNVKVFFIRETDRKYDYIEGDVIHVSCHGNVTATTYKFSRALTLALVHYPNTDWFVRTNSSTWCNVQMINTFIDNCHNPRHIFSGVLIQNTVPVEEASKMYFSDNRDGIYLIPELHDLYAQGNALIFSAEMAREFVTRCLPRDQYQASDDIIFSRVMKDYLRSIGTFEDQHFFSVGLHFSTAWGDNCPDVTEETYAHNMFIQIKSLYSEDGMYMKSANMYHIREHDAMKFINVHNRYRKLTSTSPLDPKTFMEYIFSHMNQHVMSFIDWIRITEGKEDSLHCWMMHPGIRITKDEFRQKFPVLF